MIKKMGSNRSRNLGAAIIGDGLDPAPDRPLVIKKSYTGGDRLSKKGASGTIK